MVELNNQREQTRGFRVRLVVAATVALACFGVLGARLWWLQVVQHGDYVTRADNNRISVQTLPPRRGEIFDRNGVPLARNVSTWTLEITPAEVGGRIDDIIEAVAEVIPVTALDRRRFNRLRAESSRFDSIPLRTSLTEAEAALFAAQRFRFPGVNLQSRWMREYPQGEAASHVIGYINRISQADVEHLEEAGRIGNYRGTQHIGKQGVEKSYEEVLHGQAGAVALEVTARGRPVRELRRTEPVAGRDLRLSLDIHLQRVAEAALGNQRGALVAIEPATGDILAFVSQPSFDPNLFVNGIDVENWKLLSESPDRPLINRPLSGTYPIGSTYKPFMALAGIEYGVRGPNDVIHDPGFFELAGHRFRNAGNAAYGATNMHRSLVVSSDTYYYSLASELGVNRIHDFMKPFGFGQITGIDLEGEKTGVLPSTEWKRQAYRKAEDQRWYNGETVSVGIGQGYNSFTILQLAQATAVLANDGVYMKPHVVKSVLASKHEGEVLTVPRESYRIPLQQRNIALVKAALADVNRSGTARRAFQGAPYAAAGKTGTAQVFSLRGEKYRAHQVAERLRDHALYMAFAPVDKPQIALALLVENGGWGASTAAPIARQVFDYWLVDRAAVSQLQAANEAPPGAATAAGASPSRQGAAAQTAQAVPAAPPSQPARPAGAPAQPASPPVPARVAQVPDAASDAGNRTSGPPRGGAPAATFSERTLPMSISATAPLIPPREEP
ncbi:penicillin-binding protein 2 [Verticiella sediminum]|uniref:penicillin-binding protein 2 n=1 Tax=Verticiella sediminum TaxID=1247510 RepID=UPI001B86D336|nr:penicillin-binding protein 2 [Verticiella sediminum]